MTTSKYLLDVNVLVALSEPEHLHHALANRWFDGLAGAAWGSCAFTEAGFVRVMTSPKIGGRSLERCMEILARLPTLPGFHFWPITSRWNELVAPFEERLFGHQQVTDAYLLGLAIQGNGILVTLDKGLRFLAGPQYAQNLLLIE